MVEPDTPETLRNDLQSAWHRYIDMLVPLRPALYGYCQREARDLPAHPAALPAAGADPETSAHVRDAGSRLLQRLSPQECAAVLLKEVFDMTLEEIAELLSTTTGAVKAALHRGRGRLREPEGLAASRRPLPSPELIDRFIERVGANDVKGLVALMLEGGSAENVGNSFHIGTDPSEGTPRFLYKVVHGHREWPPEFQWERGRVERVEVEGELVAAFFVTHKERERLTVVMRFEEQEGRIARIRAYGFCPETIRAVGEALGVPVLTGLYRAPTPAPGARWVDPDFPRGSDAEQV